LLAWDGTAWADTGTTFDTGSALGHLTCTGLTRCVFVAGEKVWWTT
jgi:hypothetical protein